MIEVMSSLQVRTINDLPDEILLRIFDFVVPSTHPSSNFGQLVSLTHVSPWWKIVLLKYGWMWSDIHVHGQSLDVLNVQLERCLRAPLRVSIEASDYLELPNNIQRAANLIWKCRDQVTRLNVHMDCRTFRRLLGYVWPNVEELTLTDTCFLDPRSHGGGYEGGLPRLKILCLEGGSNWPVTVASHLTAIKLGPMEFDLATIVEFFRRNKTLESLHLTSLVVWESPSYPQKRRIELPHLNELSVRDAACGSVLALLNLPSLKYLLVTSCARRNAWSGSHWSRLFGQLPVTTLEVKYCTKLHGRFVVIGSRESDPRPLYLTESSPIILGAALFETLSQASFSSVTYLFVVKNMPEGATTLPSTATTRKLLRQLPRVERLCICPSALVIKVLRQLCGDTSLCPELRKLGLVVTGETREAAAELVGEIRKARTCGGGGGGRKTMSVEWLQPTDPRDCGEGQRNRS